MALLIIGISLWYNNRLAREIQDEERLRVKLWSETVKKQAQLINLTNQTFDQLKAEEEDNIKDYTFATNEIATREFNDYTFVMHFMSKDNNIPLIIETATNQNNKITQYFEGRNLESLKDSVLNLPSFRDSLNQLLNNWERGNKSIEIKSTANQSQIFHFGDSKLLKVLKNKRDSLINSFENQLISNSASIPILYVDSVSGKIKRTINVLKNN